MPTGKRYDGNPSGHISMDNRALMATKDMIKKELDFQYQLRASEKDVSQKAYTRSSAEVFPTPRPSPLTDRSVKLFRDFSGVPAWQTQMAAGPVNDFESPAAVLATARTSATPATSGQQLRANTARQHADASQHEYLQLVHARTAIERQLAELDEVIAFKARNEARARQLPRAERPFAQFMGTHRAHADVAPVTKTVTGSWDRR